MGYLENFAIDFHAPSRGCVDTVLTRMPLQEGYVDRG